MKLLFRRIVETRNNRTDEELAQARLLVLRRLNREKLELSFSSAELDNEGQMVSVRKSLVIDLAQLFQKQTYLWLYIDHFGNPVAVDAQELLMAQDGPRKLVAVHPTITDSEFGPTLAICFGTDLDKSAVLFNRRVVYDGPAERVVGKHITDILADAFPRQHPWMTKFRDKWRAKGELKLKIEPLDSLAALEKQVDFLTGLVSELLPGLSDTQKDVLNRYLQSKSFDNLTDLEESFNTKRGLRNIILAYKSQ